VVRHEPQAGQPAQPVGEAEEILGGSIGQAQVLLEEQGGEQAGGGVRRAGVPAQAQRHDPARGGDRQPREAQVLVVHGPREMGITTSADRPFDRARAPNRTPEQASAVPI
jgi:hypothetical protein